MNVHPARPAPDDALGMMARARQRDPIGDRVHTGLIMATLFVLPLGTAPLAIMAGIAIGYSLLRLWATGPAVGYLIRLPIVWVLLGLLAWTLLSLVWSENRPEGWDEAIILRFQAPFLIAVWPIAHRWRLLVWALAAGAAAAAVIQIGQWMLPEHWPMFLWWHAERIAGRYPGLVHPNSTALVAVSAIWLLWLIRPGGARGAAAAVLLALAAAVGLALTGSRGGWIAALAGLATALPALARQCSGASRRTRAAAATLLLGILAIGLVLGPQMLSRVRGAATDLRAAIDRGDYSGDVAARWRQKDITLHLLKHHPLLGVGAGGYVGAARQYVQSHRPAVPEPLADPSVHASTGLLTHPHSALLYHAAVLGAPGLALYLAFWAALAWTPRAAGRRVPLQWWPPWAALFVAFAFDSHHMSAPGMMILMLLVAIGAYESREPARWKPSESRPSAPPASTEQPCAS